MLKRLFGARARTVLIPPEAFSSWTAGWDSDAEGERPAGTRTQETMIKWRKQRLTLSRVTLSSAIKPLEAHVSSLRPNIMGTPPPTPSAPLFSTPLQHPSSACRELKIHLSRKRPCKNGFIIFFFPLPPLLLIF